MKRNREGGLRTKGLLHMTKFEEAKRPAAILRLLQRQPQASTQRQLDIGMWKVLCGIRLAIEQCLFSDICKDPEGSLQLSCLVANILPCPYHDGDSSAMLHVA